MKRKDFLKNISLAGIPLIFKGIPVYAMDVLTEPVLDVFGSLNTNSDNILVIIQLNGGNDGLNTVLALDKYSQLSTARSNILIPETSVLSLTGNNTTGLHPSMSGMQNLYNNGQLAIIQGVSYPNPNFSHFHAQDIWFTGVGASGMSNTGWLGRGLDKKFPDYPAGYPNTNNPDPASIQIGGVMPLALQGPNVNMGYNVSNPAELVNIVNESPGDVPDNDYGAELAFLRLMKSQSNEYAGKIVASYNAQNNMSTQYPSSGNSLATQLQIVARLIGGGLQTPVYIVNHENSFDTHVAQVNSGAPTQGTHASHLQKLSTAISAFMDDLILMGKADKVIGMTYSEFGRRVVSNASEGTDHGTAAPLFVFGVKVNPGMYGVSPDLPVNPNANSQVDTQHDYRQVYTTMMQDWLGINKLDSDQVLNGEYQKIGFINTGSAPDSQGTLPIDKIQLSIKRSMKQEELAFVVCSNHYYEKFQIEISVDGKEFQLLTEVLQTTNENLKNYIYTVYHRNEPRVYYRIKGISKQQEVSFSNVIAVKNESKQFLRIYPNPVIEYKFYIEFFDKPSKNIIVEVFDMRGAKLYYNQYPSNNKLIVELPDMFDLNKLYLVKISFDGEEIMEKIFFQ